MYSTLPPWVFDWSGHLGVALYLGSYAALQAGLIRGSSYIYALLNLLAASFVLISLSAAFNLSSALIQVFWIAISLGGLARLIWLNSGLRFSPEDKALITQVFGPMPKPLARQFLDNGHWLDGEAGLILTTEGKPVTALTFLLRGEAEVTSDTRLIGRLGQGLIGEMNVLDGGSASASVTLTRPARLFTITGGALNRLIWRDSDLRLMVENAMSRDTRAKLVAANKRLSTARKRGHDDHQP
ncbi:cyclic nucleotide-binding domain-containing protein [Roseovarius sp.]|uniref:cyclic nucleotide-binding domain-containing protein n=1 Tax=Roseovarius sp. TaxID=1486281 RepID=UPI0026118DE4|nr:cyclic nucleotide-binding domain-containing protein [Roseovarius sp.]